VIEKLIKILDLVKKRLEKRQDYKNKNMKNTNILNEINEMKYLFDYKRGKVISEQESNDVTDFVVGGTQSVSVGPTTTIVTTVASSTTVKTTRKATALEVQKLLNTKYSAGLKEDGKIGPLTLGSMMNALEGSSGTSTGASVTSSSTTVASGTPTTTTTTVAGGSSSNASTGGIDTSQVGQEISLG
jgi:hypothetical protein